MGDRICVMNEGRIMQVAAPLEVYDRPANLFVAGFIGSPAMNFFTGTLHRERDDICFRGASPLPSVPVALPAAVLTARAPGRAVLLGIRPEAVSLATAPAGHVEAIVEIVEPMGPETFLHLRAGQQALVARVGPTEKCSPGDRVRIAFDLSKARLFDQQSGELLG